ncbi:MAG: metabolite traffic protein EboE, partial [Candidatus Eremiobacteraeota bacterium]|nr:metabolite traffic protein EboE [Candidatus Eremiobacteraeota bacterium]
RVAPDVPFGVGLRLSALAAAELTAPAELAELQKFLQREELYVFTINGFPYGEFHGVPVKENVYLPDWRDEQRLTYTNLLADILAALLPESVDSGSVSTVPCAFKSNVTDDAVVEAMAERLVRHVAYLVRLRERSGRTIVLALEPEPACFLETIAETVAFFREHLFAKASVARLCALTGLDGAAARAALHAHLGVCLDLCHAAVEFEDARTAVDTLRTAGIAIAKMQISAGLRVERVAAQTAAPLRAFDNGVYLHQVVERNRHGLQRYVDLAPAFDTLASDVEREWRVHFHVPIYRADLGPFTTTQPFLVEMLALHRERAISTHLEIETYTWGVLPAEHRSDDIVAGIAREMEWVLWQLAA